MNKIFFQIYIFITVFLIAKESLSLDTTAKQAIIYDLDTKSIIFEKNADQMMSPSSMSKLLTVYYIFKKISNGDVSLTDKFRVSKKAWRKGGSKMFLEYNSMVTIEDLLRGIIVQSGNDACITIAEGFSGSEENFAEELNDLAFEMGLKNSNFTNSTGWPDPDHLTTSRDLLTVAIKTIIDFPDLYKLYSEKEFTYNKIKQINRNPLLFVDDFADGLKTGHTSLGGYGLIASSLRNKRRVILIVNGLKTNNERKKESLRLMDAAFFQFTNIKVFEKNNFKEKLYVWNGVQNSVIAYSKKDLTITLPRGLKKDLKVTINYESPLSAPISKDQKIAEIFIKNKKNEIIKKFPLYSYEEITEMSFIRKIFFKFKFLIFGESIYQE